MEREPEGRDGRLRVIVEAARPEIDAGVYPVKRILGDRFEVSVDRVADGHDRVAGALLYRHAGEAAAAASGPDSAGAGTAGDGPWHELPLRDLGNDRHGADFTLDRLGLWHYTLVGWIDHAATWRHALEKKRDAGEASAADLPVELMVGAELCTAAAARARGKDAERLRQAARAMLAKGRPVAERVALALDSELAEILARYPDRSRAARYPRVLSVVVDRPRAGFSAWYEMFPRSAGAPGAHGSFRDAEARLPYIADMGFDVLYLPPIHPIGRSFRKGKNNTLTPEPDDVGSPWAVGAAEGGHTAIHPELGTLADFRHFLAAAADHGLELALDVAFQASPDHPWVTEHPAWFKHRPDGSIQYAENPPKKYQDIYPLDFETDDWQALWNQLLGVFQFWIDQGVKIFRVDNPHTKSLRFWGWCIDTLRARHPDVLFLAEAFTRPSLMYALAKLGFSQSYTYFTWRESSWDLRAYLEELTGPPVVEFFRPNFWPNTPDILPDHLMHRGRGAFAARLVLAATLSSSYGIYGPAFELMDNRPRPGSGEYLDNEKYQIRTWDIDRPDSLRPLIRRVNRIRRAHPALQQNRLLRFHGSDNPALLCFSKRTEDRSSVVLVVVNLDPDFRQGGYLHLDLGELGLPDGPFRVHDAIGGGRYSWHGSHNYVELDPYSLPAHVFTIER